VELLCRLSCSSLCISPLASGLPVFGSTKWRKGVSGGIKPFQVLWGYFVVFCLRKKARHLLFCHCSILLTHQVLQLKGRYCNRAISNNGKMYTVSVARRKASKQEWKLAGGVLKGQKFPAEKDREEVSECKRIPSLPTSRPPPSVLPPHPTRGDGRRNLASHLVANQSVV